MTSSSVTDDVILLTQHDEDEDEEFDEFDTWSSDPAPTLDQLHQQNSIQPKQ